jgi:hypothetical protein
VAAGAEDDLLAGVARVRLQRVVRGDQRGDVDQVVGGGGLSGAVTAHAPILTGPSGPREICRPALSEPRPGYGRSVPSRIQRTTGSTRAVVSCWLCGQVGPLLSTDTSSGAGPPVVTYGAPES